MPPFRFLPVAPTLTRARIHVCDVQALPDQRVRASRGREGFVDSTRQQCIGVNQGILHGTVGGGRPTAQGCAASRGVQVYSVAGHLLACPLGGKWSVEAALDVGGREGGIVVCACGRDRVRSHLARGLQCPSQSPPPRTGGQTSPRTACTGRHEPQARPPTLRFMNWRAWRVDLTLTAPTLVLGSSDCLPWVVSNPCSARKGRCVRR